MEAPKATPVRRDGPSGQKSFKRELWFHTRDRTEFVNITASVVDCLRESGVAEGLCLVNAMHITASVFVNDDERGLHSDFKEFLETLAPQKRTWRHNSPGDENGDAHVKRQARTHLHLHRPDARRLVAFVTPEAQLFGREVVVSITDGKFDFGPWEQIFYGEFDGQRDKRVLVKIIGF